MWYSETGIQHRWQRKYGSRTFQILPSQLRALSSKGTFITLVYRLYRLNSILNNGLWSAPNFRFLHITIITDVRCYTETNFLRQFLSMFVDYSCCSVTLPCRMQSWFVILLQSSFHCVLILDRSEVISSSSTNNSSNLPSFLSIAGLCRCSVVLTILPGSTSIADVPVTRVLSFQSLPTVKRILTPISDLSSRVMKVQKVQFVTDCHLSLSPFQIQIEWCNWVSLTSNRKFLSNNMLNVVNRLLVTHGHTCCPHSFYEIFIPLVGISKHVHLKVAMAKIHFELMQKIARLYCRPDMPTQMLIFNTASIH